MEETMAELIKKVRGVGIQAEITGNRQQGAYAENAALTPFYDAAIKNRNAGRSIALQEKAEANNQAYRMGNLELERDKQNYLKDQNDKNEKFQWIGAGTALLGAAGSIYANQQGNASIQKYIDAIKANNTKPSEQPIFTFDKTQYMEQPLPFNFNAPYEYTPPQPQPSGFTYTNDGYLDTGSGNYFADYTPPSWLLDIKF